MIYSSIKYYSYNLLIKVVVIKRNMMENIIDKTKLTLVLVIYVILILQGI